MRRNSRIRRMVRMFRRRIRKTETAWRKLCRFPFLLTQSDRGTRTASACSLLTGGAFFAEPQRGVCRLRTAGTCADAARAHKRDGHQGFHPSCESPRFLLASACQRAETVGERQRIFSTVGEHSVLPCLDLFAVSDSVLLRIRFHLRRRDITVSRNFWARYTGRHLRICLVGTIYLRRCCLL